MDFEVSNQVSRWVAGTDANHGFVARLAAESYNIGGPAWSFLGARGQSVGNPPYLQVTYDPPPGAPQNVTATAGNRRATVSWAAPAPNGGPAITSYTVTARRADNGAFVSSQTVCAECPLAVTFGGLTNGTGYRFEVAATNAIGNGPAASSGVVTPQVTVQPAGGPITSREGLGGLNASVANSACAQRQVTKPVNTATGNFWHSFDDLLVPGRGIPLAFSHTYNSEMAGTNGPLGFGWTHPYDMSLTITSTKVTVHQENASEVVFNASGSTYTRAAPRTDATLEKTPDNTYVFTRRGRQIFVFDAAGLLVTIKDLNANTISLNRPSAATTVVSDEAGRSFTLLLRA